MREVLELLRSDDAVARLEGYRRAMTANDDEVIETYGALDALEPRDESEAPAFWEANNRLARRCFLVSPVSAEAHVAQMDDDRALGVTLVFLAYADGGQREAEFLDALLPVALPVLGFDALDRPLPVSVRARVFAHLVELESVAGELAGPATLALSEESAEVVHLANALIQSRAEQSLAELLR